MASGVSLAPDVLTEYNSVKQGRAARYIIFRLSDDLKNIIVDKKVPNASYDDFVADLPEQECRWAVYDFEYEKDGGPRNKLVFYSWSPDVAKIKPKMVYSSSKDVLRRSLEGIGIEIQGTDYSEVSHEEVLSKVQRLR